MKLTKDSQHICVICKTPFTGFGHNPEPVHKFAAGRACDICNDTVVVPVRLRKIFHPTAVANTEGDTNEKPGR